MEYSIKVTNINRIYNARLFSPGMEIIDEIACELKEDIGWVCRYMLRWRSRLGDDTPQTSHARSNLGAKPKSRWWYTGNWEERLKCGKQGK